MLSTVCEATVPVVCLALFQAMMIRTIAITIKIPPTAIGRRVSSGPAFTLTGGRRPDLDLTLAPRTAALVRVWFTRLIEYRPTLSGLGRWHSPPIERGLNP